MNAEHDSAEDQEFLAPSNGGWHYTTMRDWIAVCPDIGPTAIRLYWIIRSIMHEKGDKSRRLSVDHLCWLLPGVNGKPTSATRVKDALRELEQAGLLSNPDDAVTRQWVRDPRTGKQTKENFRRWQIHDHARPGYGGWRSVAEKLAAYPGPGCPDPAEVTTRRPEFVYLIGSLDSRLVKIGMSDDVQRRLDQLQRMSPAVLRVLWQTEGGRELEAALHRKLWKYRQHGEWFDFGNRDAVSLVSRAAVGFKNAPPPGGAS